MCKGHTEYLLALLCEYCYMLHSVIQGVIKQ